MYFRFNCTKCDKSLRVREEHGGKKVRCPYCHHMQTVPMPQRTAAPTGEGEVSGGATTGSTSSGGGEIDRKSFVDGTEVGMLKSSIYAFLVTGLFYGVVTPLYLMYPKAYFPRLFAGSWVTYLTVFLTVWSVMILMMKWRKLNRQQESMLFDLLPNDIGTEITSDNVTKFQAHIAGLPIKPSGSFLVNRVTRGLEHFRVLRNSSEVAARLQSQSDIDATAVDSSYTLMKVFVWAIPILGFIGTVIGIGGAVGGFATGMDNASDISALKDSLGVVTGGLGTAFDTTLVALVLSMFVMFPMSSMQKSEEDLLNWVDEYCNENLLKRLKDRAAGSLTDGDGRPDDDALRRAIDTAMIKHHAELKTWTLKLEKIGSALTEQVLKGWKDVDSKIAERQDQTFKNAERLDLTLTEMVDRARNSQVDMAASIKDSADIMTAEFSELQKGLGALNNLLAELGEKQVVVKVERPPADEVDVVPERGGWSLFGRRNGR
ncbi:MotA/TolQ/ExbB proton channel family protein [Calycomorphotria hydatis]|uniref:MotA/TolQ/ExbB proton channel domain-containing protein n=1 Tax=Calycomorphotria hydatis TaxID=2528027 RepID=A0A517TAU3_9PLAN|nr:MotA/TolQ/ExbB proton channel family protein [Calycomorphotria hydatis]QDT65493.1 hypothetical protein V22_27470 [Calycomorphotria hydatis]